jgi:predicted small secreted protein
LLSLLQMSNCNLNTNMSTFIKRIVVLLFVTSLLAIVGVGCNTAHGFGKDMENAGDSIQNGTK